MFFITINNTFLLHAFLLCYMKLYWLGLKLARSDFFCNLKTSVAYIGLNYYPTGFTSPFPTHGTSVDILVRNMLSIGVSELHLEIFRWSKISGEISQHDCFNGHLKLLHYIS